MKMFKLSLLGMLVAGSVNAEVNHTPFGPIKIGERAKVESTLTDDEAIKDARLYFKSNMSKSFSYTDLNMSGANLFASLPAPGPSMQNIEYFIAVKYVNGELEQTPVYSLNISGDWDESAKQEYANAVLAYTELSKQEDDSLNGFVDNVRSGFQAAKLLNKLGSAVELSNFSNYAVVAGPTSSGSAGVGATAGAGSSSSFGNAGWVAAGAGAAAALALAAAGGAEEKDEAEKEEEEKNAIIFPQEEEDEFDPEGSYVVTLSGANSLESGSSLNDCEAGAILRFSPVSLIRTGGDDIEIDLGGVKMDGKILNSDNTSILIFDGESGVNSDLITGLKSTTKIAWSTFTLDFEKLNSEFSSNSFTLETKDDNGVDDVFVSECKYSVTMSGHLAL